MITPLTLRPPTPPTPVAPYDLDYLIVGGGGGGGATGSCTCGGAGGYKSGQLLSTTNSVYTMYIGAGGAAGTSGFCGGTSALQSSVFINALGGGAFVWRINPVLISTNTVLPGSGRGGQDTSENLGTDGQGNSGRGARPSRGFVWGMGGGGGAGAAGDWAEFTAKGGDGLTWLDGITRGGGAGGWRNLSAPEGVLSGAPGAGGGGRSSNTEVTPAVVAEAGAANTGGGGGGGFTNSSGNNTGTAQPGGSGIIKVRYAGTPRATGGTITQDGGFTYHAFTSSGRLIFTS